MVRVFLVRHAESVENLNMESYFCKNQQCIQKNDSRYLMFYYNLVIILERFMFILYSKNLLKYPPLVRILQK